MMFIMAKGRENQPHIGIFGRRNVGKSSLINSISGQDLAIVSNHAGTTTDPVKKSFEIPNIGACVLIDTAGIDDEGEVGKLRIEKTLKTLDLIDAAVLVIAHDSFGEFEKNLIKNYTDLSIPFCVIYNQWEDADKPKELEIKDSVGSAIVNAKTGENIDGLISLLRKTIPDSIFKRPKLVGDIIKYGDVVLLITPIDNEAPEGRMILPQVQTIRDILDNDAIAVILKEREVDVFLKKTGIKPDLVVTDSSIFLKADASIPKDIPLTGFSVLLARHKGDFDLLLQGTPKIDDLKDNDIVLILESCSHHVACDDIGRIKIPRWLNSYTGKKIEYDVVAGLNKLPRPIKHYALIVQCGGCVLTHRQLHNRLRPAINSGVPITNYGMAIAYIQGIYKRAVAPFMNNDTVHGDDLYL